MWHMVFEEEIGSVKGHIGPMRLGVKSKRAGDDLNMYTVYSM